MDNEVYHNRYLFFNVILQNIGYEAVHYPIYLRVHS